MLEPLDEALGGVAVHAAVNDLVGGQAREVLVRVGLGVERRQKRKRARRGDARGLVLDVVDDEAVDAERGDAIELLGDDGFELLRWRRRLRWSAASHEPQ